MTLTVVPFSKLPKRNYCRAAECRFDFDQIASRLGVRPARGTFRDRLPFPNRYRQIYLSLSSGRFAGLTQTEMRKSVIEIGLELHNDNFFYEEDLLEIQSAIGVDTDYVERIGNGYQWIPAREPDPNNAMK